PRWSSGPIPLTPTRSSPPLETATALATSEATAATATFSPILIGFPTAAADAFQQAMGIWGGLISSPVPIKVSASFEGHRPLALSTGFDLSTPCASGCVSLRSQRRAS
ncbi:MAG: hypothetical protein ABR540_21340, partial [Acidimicrobiales bacterium]